MQIKAIFARRLENCGKRRLGNGLFVEFVHFMVKYHKYQRLVRLVVGLENSDIVLSQLARRRPPDVTVNPRDVDLERFLEANLRAQKN